MQNSKIKIRTIKINDIKPLKKFLQNLDTVQCHLNTQFQMSRLFMMKFNQLLPLSWKFMQDTYIALENDTIIGVIQLSPESRYQLCWKISNLLIEPNHYFVAKLLLDFVINKYGANGIETFITEVDITKTDLLAMFKKACGFRDCTRNHLFLIPEKYIVPHGSHINHFRQALRKDSQKLQSLYNDCLFPKVRVSLAKSDKDFSDSIFNSINEVIDNVYIKHWLIDDPNTNMPIAYVKLINKNSDSYFISIYTALPYSEYYLEIINNLVLKIRQKNKSAFITVNVCEAIQNYSYLQSVLQESIKAELLQTSVVLVKDYWRPLKVKKLLNTSIVTFSDGTSPACNFNN